LKPLVFIAEDEETLRDLIVLNLELEGYEVKSVTNGKDAINLLNHIQPDLIILDVMLPHLSGFDVCKQYRIKNSKTPVLFLTAKASASDRVNGLKLGADDYLTKPFNLEELLLRVKKLIQRTSGNDTLNTSHYEFADYLINFNTYEIYQGQKKLYDLSKRESKLLRLLTEKANQVVSREEILDKVWGEEAYPTSRTIDNFILAFRKYFKDNPRSPRYFHSIRGIGYKFTPHKQV
jgi:two-component system alkaline phosphatase synthesis response regulator PhoP